MSSDNSQLEAARQQVSDVQNVMQSNVNKLMEREGKLSQLEERADQLQVIKLISIIEDIFDFFCIFQAGTEQFHRAAVKIKRKHFWENAKMKIIIGVVISVVVIIIIIVASQ